MMELVVVIYPNVLNRKPVHLDAKQVNVFKTNLNVLQKMVVKELLLIDVNIMAYVCKIVHNVIIQLIYTQNYQ